MKLEFVDFFAKTIIFGVVVLFIVLLITGTEETHPITAIPVAICSVAATLYPISILFRRSQETSYSFLKNWWHYTAMILTLLYWVNMFSNQIV